MTASEICDIPSRQRKGIDKRESYLSALVVVLLIGTAVARLVPTYTLFTQTFDEPTHVTAGLAWLAKALTPGG
jgi:hypothetical protein